MRDVAWQRKQWHTIARVSLKTVPFGYKINDNNDRLLDPVLDELEALEVAKKHLLQYSYREVAQWLSRQTGRSISHTGLKKRIDIERKRKKTVTIKRRLAQKLAQTLQEIENLETQKVGTYAK